MTQITPIILSGGSGTRLWPVSRKSFPKQFAPLLDGASLYQRTISRFSGPLFAAPMVMTREEFRFMATEQAGAQGLSDVRVVVEPVARDTAPAILAAALAVQREDRDAVILVAPSDHLIADEAAFQAAIETAKGAAEDGALVTFGVTPDRPETGFGYLELARRPDGPTPVSRFTEKPDRETARAFVDGGRHLWNAGLFMGRARDFVAAFEAHAPDMIAPVSEALDDAASDLGFTRLAEEPFSRVRAVSIDYAIMEKTDPVMAVPLDCGWSDLGAWTALLDAAETDAEGNAAEGRVTVIDCKNSYLRADDPMGPRLVGLGLDDVVAVAMRDAVLVADAGRAQDVKRAVEELQAIGAPEADENPRFYRPWGWYETLCLGSRFQVKRIMVKPGGILSLQSHMHRSEHWVVVEGTAEVTIGEEVRLVTENQSVYIPLGTVHRMANRGQLPMYLIEVQTGAYLGEDDITRYEDVYDRK